MKLSGIKWIAPLILVVSGCTNISLSPSAEPEKLKQLAEQQKYGQALAIIASVPTSAPEHAELEKLRKSITKQATAYQRKTLQAGKNLEQQGEWYQAHQQYQQALDNLRESRKIQAALDKLQRKIDTRVASLETDLLMAKGVWIKQQLAIQAKLSPLISRKLLDPWRQGSVKKEAIQTSAELGLVGQHAIQQGDFSLAEKALDLSLQLNPDPEIKKTREALSKKKQRARVKSVQDKRKALSVSLERALKKGELKKASGIAARLKKQGTPNQKEQKLIQQLNRDIKTLVTKQLQLGADHYSRGEYPQAVSAWDNVLKLDPNNTEANTRIKRANRVLAKLRKLSKEKGE